MSRLFPERYALPPSPPYFNLGLPQLNSRRRWRVTLDDDVRLSYTCLPTYLFAVFQFGLERRNLAPFVRYALTRRFVVRIRIRFVVSGRCHSHRFPSVEPDPFLRFASDIRPLRDVRVQRRRAGRLPLQAHRPARRERSAVWSVGRRGRCSARTRRPGRRFVFAVDGHFRRGARRKRGGTRTPTTTDFGFFFF